LSPIKATVRVEGDHGTLELDPLPKELKPGQSWGFPLLEGDVAVLQREGASALGFFAGTLSALSLDELFGLLISGVRSGRLTVEGGGCRRQLALVDGEVTFAVSSEPTERLGAMVVKQGLLTKDQVDEAALASKPGERLGAVLIRNELLTPTQLYEVMVSLVREVVIKLFQLTEGHFLFVEGTLSRADAVKLPERTRELILLGMQRAEEASRERAASEKAASEPSEPEGGPGAPPAPPGPEPVHGPEARLSDYRNMLSAIAQALIAAEKGLNGLRAYLGEPGPKWKSAFAGVELSDEGLLDVERVRKNLDDEDKEYAWESTFDALDALVAYSLFSAQNVLPSDVFAKLTGLAGELRKGANKA
jgi:hypothetical protein